jgi:membrane-associated phospholipid phosphatase/tRNA A-37 threonylcarbamoyl transferase component Bud32
MKATESARRQRRPSGEAPPLPRELNRGDRWFLGVAAAVIVLWLLLLFTTRTSYWLDRADNALLDQFVRHRSKGTIRLARSLQDLGSKEVVIGLRLATVAALLVFRRFRHLCVLVGCYLTVGFVSELLVLLFERPRPLGYELLGDWQGYSHPSLPVAELTVTLVGACFTLAPRGRPRWIAGWVGVGVVAVLGTARVLLGVDHPSDVLFAAVLATTIAIIAFRVFTPDQVFPVTYRRGRSAHLEVGDERAAAIRTAVRDQLGVEVVDISPFGLAGSAGSTPLLLTPANGDKLFAKLYAANHVRSDRWYKLGRTILYGRLEDEQPFSTVRRLVQYEDYLSRVTRDAGVPTPEPSGIVEITPEREYLLVTEFVEGGHEITEVEVDDALIDDGLRVVRALWDAGLAHRDIKPANVLVHENRIVLIDVAFSQVRPTPWRQAVDLANMMLVLATRTDAERVYERARRVFTPDDVAEAFAATRGVTSPTQLRGLLRHDGRDLVGRFRALAPPRRPIAIQRWSLRRIGLIVAVLATALVAVIVLLSGFGPGGGG